MNDKIPKTEEEWKSKLTPEQYEVLRSKATEPAFSGKYLDNHDEGTFLCTGCGSRLFESDTKFDSGSGWPSFDKAIEGAIGYVEDSSSGMIRTEAVCSACKSHLGHVFADGPTETGKRYCINSSALLHKKNK